MNRTAIRQPRFGMAWSVAQSRQNRNANPRAIRYRSQWLVKWIRAEGRLAVDVISLRV